MNRSNLKTRGSVRASMLLAGVVVLSCSLRAGEPAAGLSSRQAAVHALNRLSFGPTQGQIDEVAELGWKKWAEQQLDPQSIDDQAMEKRLEKYPSLQLSLTELFKQYQPDPKKRPGEKATMKNGGRLPVNAGSCVPS